MSAIEIADSSGLECTQDDSAIDLISVSTHAMEAGSPPWTGPCIATAGQDQHPHGSPHSQHSASASSVPVSKDTPESKKLRVAAASPRQFGGVNVRTHAACLPTARRSMARQFEAAAPAGPSRMLEGIKAGPSGGHKTGIAWEEGETCVVLAAVDMHAQRVVEGKIENKMLFKICQAVESSGLVPGRSATSMMRMVEGHPKTGRMNYSIPSKVVDDLANGPEFRQFSAPVHAPPPVQPPVALEHAGPVEMTIGRAKTGTKMNFSQLLRYRFNSLMGISTFPLPMLSADLEGCTALQMHMYGYLRHSSKSTSDIITKCWQMLQPGPT
eukprot:gene7815-1012_t